MMWMLYIVFAVSIYGNIVQGHHSDSNEHSGSQEDCVLCTTVPDCSFASAPWCVQKWPYHYAEAKCEQNCATNCSATWFTDCTKVTVLECPTDKVCPTTNATNVGCFDACTDSAVCFAGQLCCPGAPGVCHLGAPGGLNCNEDLVEPDCPDSSQPISCPNDPCDDNQISPRCRKNFPNATCVSGNCNECNYFWFETSDLDKPLKCPKETPIQCDRGCECKENKLCKGKDNCKRNKRACPNNEVCCCPKSAGGCCNSHLSD